MKKFSIGNRQGADLGIYEAETEAAALDVMARDAGYSDYRDACSITLTSPTEAQLDAEVERCRAQMYVVEIKD